jgi:hypothetical protein
MLPAIALTLALLAPQATTPAAPQSDPPATQPAPQPAAPAKPPCRNPDAAGKYRIGCGVTQPELIFKVDPEIPKPPKNFRFVSTPVITLTVGVDGLPQDVHVKVSQVDNVDKSARAFQQQFENNAVEAVKQYKFKPATYQGKPVPVELNVEVNIDLF